MPSHLQGKASTKQWFLYTKYSKRNAENRFGRILQCKNSDKAPYVRAFTSAEGTFTLFGGGMAEWLTLQTSHRIIASRIGS
jgi:hypothetical protein